MTKYIPLEHLEKFLIEIYGFGEFQLRSIRELSTIDPIADIDKMIEDELNPEGTTINESRLRCLEDVIGRIKGEPPSRHNIT